jgi:plastocyanin
VKNVNLTWQDNASGTPVTTVKVGGTVTWTISAGPPHSLKRVAGTPENGCEELDAGFDSNLSAGQPVSRKFDKVGTFGYQCGIHTGKPNCKNPPSGEKMWGVIKVVP